MLFDEATHFCVARSPMPSLNASGKLWIDVRIGLAEANIEFFAWIPLRRIPIAREGSLVVVSRFHKVFALLVGDVDHYEVDHFAHLGFAQNY